jgi:hypothetical protein
MIMTSSRHLALVVALLAGGAALAMIGFLTRQQIIARQASAPESSPTAQHFTPADQIGQALPVVTVQEVQPTSTPSSGPVRNSMGPTTGAVPPCDQSDGGLSRIVQIDTTGGPRFGLIQHPSGYDFLRDKEVVLTFDDGPWPGSTQAVLKALSDQCLKATFTDIDSRDFTMHKSQQVVDSVMSQLEKRGKGIILLQDFHRNTAEALPDLLRQLKLAGYKVVHMVPKEQLSTLPKYDEMFNHLESVSSSAQTGSAATRGNDAATHHGIYMYVPPQGRKGPPTTGTAGTH